MKTYEGEPDWFYKGIQSRDRECKSTDGKTRQKKKKAQFYSIHAYKPNAKHSFQMNCFLVLSFSSNIEDKQIQVWYLCTLTKLL